jgi:hypothetical protein
MKIVPALIILTTFFLLRCQTSRQDPSGYPDRSADLDVLPGFKNPPPGYGEVPFWWWTGDTLNTERLAEQVDELHAKGISGVQVNYSHYDTPGWLTEQDDPPIFSEKWWEVYSTISSLCADRDMGIGLSTYTLDWPQGANNLFYQLFYHKEELNAIEIRTGLRKRIKGGTDVSLPLTTSPVAFRSHSWAAADHEDLVQPDLVTVYAYAVKDGQLQTEGLDLTEFVQSGELNWTAPEGEWEVWEYLAVRKPGSLNPLMEGAGDTVVQGFFQKFQDRKPDKSAEGLNYFFNDELHIGVGKYAWNPDFAEEFSRRKGYDLMEVLPAMWDDIGPVIPKVRMDYADVRMSLMEERYFKPVYQWHRSRGMIFGCDSGGRGLNPAEFGDYFRATRWYTAPGHDTPGGKADLIKGKVSSSIANLYQQPRVWLEGYHSLGWGATPAQLMFATRENYLYGCTLLNLHGLYYTTYGSYWEWAPPCYHFRMPYWKHMDVFLGYFERLSYLLSQGHLVTDVAVIYPVAPYEAEMDGNKARETAFDLGRSLMAAGINFEFIDHESLTRAVVEDGKLKVKSAGSAYQTLVFPDMNAVRWTSLEKAAAFAQGGGKVYVTGALPVASDRAGRDDAELSGIIDVAFKPEYRLGSVDQTVGAIEDSFVQDVRGIGQTVRALHRKAGFRDVYMVMDARPGTVVEFRAKGAVELWDPWTGETSPLRVVEETQTGTRVELPLEAYEASIVVFTPGKKHVNPPEKSDEPVKEITLPDEWQVAFIPTMDNRWGDFRMPVTEANKTIGVEARRFTWSRENVALQKTAMLPETDDSQWEEKLHGFGTQFYVLGPVPKEVDLRQLETRLATMQEVDPGEPVKAGNRTFYWEPYDFSWRWGKEGDQGHQGYHGLKRTVTDDFICLGKPVGALNETRYVEEIGGGRYYIWSCATLEEPLEAEVLFSTGPPEDKSHTSPILTPVKIYVNGKEKSLLEKDIKLEAGVNPLLIRYDHAGRGHFVLRRKAVAQPEEEQRLAMRWWNDPGVIPFDVTAGDQSAEWFRFTSAPGTAAISLQAQGEVKAWIDSQPMKDEGNGRFRATVAPAEAAVVALRICPRKAGLTGGGLIPDPVKVETSGTGKMTLGDWSEKGILNNYSGGVFYRTTLTLSEADAESSAVIDLGQIGGTAEIIVNGKTAGIRVAPPWKQEVTGMLEEGENSIDVMIYNTLANHYQTIPSRYRGEPMSGLLEKVKLLLK